MRRRVLLSAAGAAALLISGCVSLLPKTTPAQLYELNADLGPALDAPAAAKVNVRLGPVAFKPAAGGDRLLTVNGEEAAFVGGARWEAPAQTLFDAALARAFETRARTSRLISRADATGSSYILSIDVDDFEVRYVTGRGAPPSAEVSLRARLVRYPERTVMLDRTFTADAPASADRVSAIVRAYDKALGEALDGLIEATDQQTAKAAPVS
jgi:cholesterol transport system auxiliary component